MAMETEWLYYEGAEKVTDRAEKRIINAAEELAVDNVLEFEQNLEMIEDWEQRVWHLQATDLEVEDILISDEEK